MAVVDLKGLAMIFVGQENPLIIFRRKEIYIHFKTNNKIICWNCKEKQGFRQVSSLRALMICADVGTCHCCYRVYWCVIHTRKLANYVTKVAKKYNITCSSKIQENIASFVNRWRLLFWLHEYRSVREAFTVLGTVTNQFDAVLNNTCSALVCPSDHFKSFLSDSCFNWFIKML